MGVFGSTGDNFELFGGGDEGEETNPPRRPSPRNPPPRVPNVGNRPPVNAPVQRTPSATPRIPVTRTPAPSTPQKPLPPRRESSMPARQTSLSQGTQRAPEIPPVPTYAQENIQESVQEYQQSHTGYQQASTGSVVEENLPQEFQRGYEPSEMPLEVQTQHNAVSEIDLREQALAEAQLELQERERKLEEAARREQMAEEESERKRKVQEQRRRRELESAQEEQAFKKSLEALKNNPAETEEDTEEEEAPAKRSFGMKKKANVSKGNNSKNASKSKSKGKGTKEPKAFDGGRRKVLVTNLAVVGVVLTILGFGAKNAFFPAHIPTPDEVTSLISTQMNVTNFNKEGGKVIVTSFTKAYFTTVKDVSKTEQLTPYTTPALADTIASSITTVDNAQQNVSEPTILNIRATDDYNATYTVGLKVGTQWYYLDVPVFYNDKTLAYAISDTPTFVPPPSVADLQGTATPEDGEIESDVNLSSAQEPNMTEFFKAWTLSDQNALSRYLTNDSSPVARVGMQKTLHFVLLDTLEIQMKEEGDPTSNERRANATITLGNTPKNPTFTYKITYAMKLFKQPDGRWYVSDLKPLKNVYTTLSDQSALNNTEVNGEVKPEASDGASAPASPSQ